MASRDKWNTVWVLMKLGVGGVGVIIAVCRQYLASSVES